MYCKTKLGFNSYNDRQQNLFNFSVVFQVLQFNIEMTGFVIKKIHCPLNPYF